MKLGFSERYLSPFRRREIAAGLGLLTVAASVLSASSAAAQQSAPPASARSAPSAPPAATVLLMHALQQAYGRSEITVLADSTVSYERIPQSVLADLPSAATPAAVVTETEAQIEKGLNVLVKSLPPGTVWGKLYLPAPAKGRTWKGDDVAAFAFAQARLFGTVGMPVPDGSIEVLGKRVSKEGAPPLVAALGLKPVYLLTNTKRRLSVLSWSAANEEQWKGMSKEERKEYGAAQAAQIMALSPEDRAQVLEQIRQHDQFFDTVKDPLESLLGHDL